MFESLQHLANGFGIAGTVQNLFYCLIGCIVGTIIGVLPGIGPSLELPFLFRPRLVLIPLQPSSCSRVSTMVQCMEAPPPPSSSMSLGRLLLSSPVSMVTDGPERRAGPALAIVAIGSFIAGTIGIFGLVFLAPPLAEAALAFGPPEYFSLMVFGFIVLSNVTGKSLLKSLMMAIIGLIIGTIGIDIVTGDARFTYRSVYLLGGIEFVAVAIGLFGIGEVLVNVNQPSELLDQGVLMPRLRELYPSLQDLKKSMGAIFRGAVSGFGIGLVPGPAPVIATYASYMIRERFLNTPRNSVKERLKGWPALRLPTTLPASQPSFLSLFSESLLLLRRLFFSVPSSFTECRQGL